MAVNRLKDRYRIKGNRLDDSINSMIDKNPRLRGYRRPDCSDLLFSNDLHSVKSLRADNCRNSSNAIMRPERTERKDNPVIHYGKIASGNQFIKDAAFRDALSKAESILCFETGAAGVVSSFTCPVICGISNYADSHHSPTEVWDTYSAIAAAGYAKDILQVIPAEDGNNTDETSSHEIMTKKGKS